MDIREIIREPQSLNQDSMTQYAQNHQIIQIFKNIKTFKILLPK